MRRTRLGLTAITGVLAATLLGGAASELSLDAADRNAQLAALRSNEARWEYSELPQLIALERAPDLEVREAARLLVRRYLIWGPQRPTWIDRRDADRSDFEPHDRMGLRAWRGRAP